MTTSNANPNALWVAKEFIVTARLCNVACTSCTSSSPINSCFSCNVSLGYRLSNNTCMTKCVFGFGRTTNPGLCVWCDLKCALCYERPNNCTRCVTTGPYASSLVYDATLGYLTCVKTCPNGSVANNGQCIYIWGCIGVIFKGPAQTCVRCNPNLKLTLYNNSCVCA